MHRSYFTLFTIQNRNMHILLWIVHCGMWDRYMVGFVDFGLFSRHIRVWPSNIEISTWTRLSAYIGPINVGSIGINTASLAITPRRNLWLRVEAKAYQYIYLHAHYLHWHLFRFQYIYIYINNNIFMPVPGVSRPVVKHPAQIGSQWWTVYYSARMGWCQSVLTDGS